MRFFPTIIIFTIYLISGLKIVNQYEKHAVFTLWKYTTILEPGLRFVWPFFQSTNRIDLNKNIDELSVELNSLNLPSEVITKLLSEAKKSNNSQRDYSESVRKD